MVMQASSVISSSLSSPPMLAGSPSSCLSLTFGKSFFKSFFINEGERISSQFRSHTRSQLMDRRSLPTTSARDTTTITTRLPPELWLLILRYATYPPLPWFGTSSMSSSSASDRHYHSHHNSTTLPFHIRLTNYASQLEWKASLTRVCKDWNVWGQQFLWEDLWIASAKDGKVLAGLICGKRGQVQWRTEQGQPQERRMGRSHPALSATSQRRGTLTEVKVGKGKVVFSLKRLRGRSHSKSSVTTTHTHMHPQTTSSFSLSRRKNIASYIKRLHIETPSMDKCCPSDLISILEKCERLEVFIDLRSVRSGFGYVDVGVGGGLPRSRIGVGKKSALTDPERVMIPERHLFPQSRIPSTSDPILQTLLHPTTHQKPTLKHLTFTNYKYDPDDFEGGVWFWEDVVCGALNGVQDASQASTLESLEIVMSTRGVGMDYGYGYARRHISSTLLNRRLESGLLTSLDFDINPSASNHLSLTLPFLHSLRIPLTSPTLLVVATWSLPSLQSLSLVSIDFTGWRRMGFKKFMEVHGGGLIRFEIVGGGESGEEEGWITEREVGTTSSAHHQRQNLHLPSTSPLLKHFICSSNASEWNWETPDWIAPHVLMPEHFGVERIGVWGLEGKVVRGDYDGMGTTLGTGRRRRRTTSLWSRRSIQDDDEEHLLEEQPFFMLQEQFGSLLRREAFPSLVCIRDMSWESDLIRKSVGIGSSEPESPTVDPATPIPSTKRKHKSLKETVASRFTRPNSSSTSSSIPSSPISATQTQLQFEPQSQSYKIRKFWLGVLERCDRRGVYLEDWMGRRVVA